MQTTEANVWIIEDSESKLERLSALVTENGGNVVGVSENVTDALNAVTAPDFPENMGGPNVVFIDQQLPRSADQQSTRGLGGHHIFTAGDRIGVLRRADEPEIGIVAFGTSSDPDAEIVALTGVHFLPRYLDQTSVRWGQLLQPHPADPDTAPRESFERKRFDGFPAQEMLRVLQGENRLDETVTLQALTHLSNTGDRTPQVVTGAPIGAQVHVSGQDGSIASLLNGGEGIRQAIVTTPTELVVIRHTVLPATARDVFGPQVVRRGRSDHIPRARAQDLPNGYWKAIGINPKALRG